MGMSVSENVREIAQHSERMIRCPGIATDITPAQVGQTLFTIYNDPIIVRYIFGVVTTLIGAGAATPFLQHVSNAAYGAVTSPICALSASIANVTTGTILQMTGVAAGILTVSAVRGKRAVAEATGIWGGDYVVLVPGVIQIVNATSAVGGIIDWYMNYIPCSQLGRVTVR